jgi:quercetin dioxygenase-like cupin family protein
MSVAMDANQINWDDLRWEQVREAGERKAISGPGATVALNRLMPGHAPTPHSHPHEQIAYILSGRMDFFIEGQVFHLRAGGMPVVPSNARHWGQVVGKEPVLNLDVFTPRRSKYA